MNFLWLKKYVRLPMGMAFSFNKNIPLLLFANVDVKLGKIKFCAGLHNGKIIAEDETLFKLLKDEKLEKYLAQRNEEYFHTVKFCRRKDKPNFFGNMGLFVVGSYCFFCERLEYDWVCNAVSRLTREFIVPLYDLLEEKIGKFLNDDFRPSKKDTFGITGDEGYYLSYCPFSWFKNAKNWDYNCDDGLLTYFYWLGKKQKPFPEYTWLFPREYARALRNFYEYGREKEIGCLYWWGLS